MNGFKPPTWSTKRSARGARLPFCILTVVGDVLDDGELHFVETAQTFEAARRRIDALARSEEHTSELQSHSDLVCRLLLEKKKGCLTASSAMTIAVRTLQSGVQCTLS